MKFNHITVPTDFSEASINALRYAAGIAKRGNSRVTLLHVYERPYITTYEGAIMNATVDSSTHAEIREEIFKELHRIKDMDFMQGLEVDARLIKDKSPWEFYENLDPEKDDLVVMGTHGVTGLIHGGLVGTNTERVIRYSKVPVLSVPEHSQYYDEIDKVMFATDFKSHTTAAFKEVMDFAKLFDAEIEVAVINTHDNISPTKEVNEKFEAIKNEYNYEKMKMLVYNEDSVVEGIRDLSLKRDIDVVAMMTHGRTGMARLFRDSIAEDVSATVKTPLLAFHHEMQERA